MAVLSQPAAAVGSPTAVGLDGFPVHHKTAPESPARWGAGAGGSFTS